MCNISNWLAANVKKVQTSWTLTNLFGDGVREKFSFFCAWNLLQTEKGIGCDVHGIQVHAECIWHILQTASRFLMYTSICSFHEPGKVSCQPISMPLTLSWHMWNSIHPDVYIVLGCKPVMHVPTLLSLLCTHTHTFILFSSSFTVLVLPHFFPAL